MGTTIAGIGFLIAVIGFIYFGIKQKRSKFSEILLILGFIVAVSGLIVYLVIGE